jgi:hypothetical protein
MSSSAQYFRSAAADSLWLMSSSAQYFRSAAADSLWLMSSSAQYFRWGICHHFMWKKTRSKNSAILARKDFAQGTALWEFMLFK